MLARLKLWESYWEQRAAGAIRHAKYKELPAVRARRIKGLGAELRKQQRSKEAFKARVVKVAVMEIAE